ncbi:DNA translocase FtsK, partial [Blautia sp. MSK22_86]
DVVAYLKDHYGENAYDPDIEKRIHTVSLDGGSAAGGGDNRDNYFVEAGKFIIEKDKASIGMLQRVLKIGFNRAARIMDQLADAGVVGPEEGTKPRKVLMSMEQFENYLEEHG